MPEGDAVWRTARTLRAAIEGSILRRSDFRVSKYATLDLSGEQVDEVLSRGKHLLIRIGPATVHSHLRMEGAWHTYRHGDRWGRPGHQARVVLENATWQTVGFALGALNVVGRDEEDRLVGHLGPDLLGSDWDLDRAVANLTAHPDRAVGIALLDQRNLAGIGNIYRNEVCFVRGVDPRSAIRSVDEVQLLVGTARRMLSANLAHAAIVTTGNRRRGEQTWVYGRAGKACRRCGTIIVRDDLGGADDVERSVYVCPSCQPAAPREESASQ